MGSNRDPCLLYSISGIQAHHVQDGEETSLTPSGPQTLSLLMVPTSSDAYGPNQLQDNIEEDFYLHLNLPPELDLPLPATTQIYHQPPRSYLIPRWDLGPDAGAFTRIEFPPIGVVSQEDVDTFETILAQCTAFLERAQPPSSSKDKKAYNPAEYAPGEAYATGTAKGQHGQIVLIDEDDGSVVGELGGNAHVVEDPAVKQGSKNPVEIHVSADGSRVDVRPVSDEYLKMASLPAYQSSSLVQNAATASRLIVTTSEQISGVLTSGAESFTQRTKPASKPLLFTPAAHKRARKISQLTQGAAGLSAKTVGTVSKYAQNLGATVTRNKGRAYDRDGRPNEGHKPGFLNKSLIAFSTIMDGMEYSGRALLDSGSAAATTIVGHRFGENARALAAELGGSAKNVGLVYIDVTGVSRRAIIKSVAKGMVVGRVKGGGQVIVGGGDGGSFPPGSLEKANAGPSGTARHDQQTVGYGQTEDSAVPPPYAANGTEPPREKYS